MIRNFRERTRSTSSRPGSFDVSASPRDVATEPATCRGSVRLSRSTKWTSPPNSSAAARPTAKAMVVLPIPPGPSRVTNRAFRSFSLTSLTTVSPNHHDRSHGEPALGGEPGVPAFRATSQRDDGADERIAPSLDVCDVSIAELAVTKHLADCGHVDPKASLLNGYVRPDVIHQLLLRDDLTWAVRKIG